MKERNRAAVTELLAFDTVSEKTKRTVVEGRDFYSLSYRYSGKVWLKSENSELVSDAGSVTFMPKGMSYETEVMEDTHMTAVHFKLDGNIDFRNPSVISVGDKDIQHLFEKLTRSYRVDKPMDFRCMSIFYDLLASLESVERHESEDRIPRKIRLAMDTMLSRFSDPLLSISSVAEELGISTSYLRREFSAAYGKSPIAFLIDLRIENAKNLLQSEYLTVSAIAEQSGFSSASYFIQVFHKTVGSSPDRYRQKDITQKESDR